jgi:hypothetical protein
LCYNEKQFTWALSQDYTILFTPKLEERMNGIFFDTFSVSVENFRCNASFYIYIYIYIFIYIIIYRLKTYLKKVKNVHVFHIITIYEAKHYVA